MAARTNRSEGKVRPWQDTSPHQSLFTVGSFVQFLSFDQGPEEHFCLAIIDYSSDKWVRSGVFLDSYSLVSPLDRFTQYLLYSFATHHGPAPY